MRLIKNIILILTLAIALPLLAHAAYTPFNANVAGNIGVGTTTPQGKFVVVGGNVGIGTWTAAGGNLIVNGGGNVGIGSAWPGVALDVTGALRTSGNISNGVLTINGGAGFMSSTTSFSQQAGTYYRVLTNANNEKMRIDVNGNMGIGTAIPTGELDVEGSLYPTVFYGRGTNQNVGIGSVTPGQALDVNGTVRATQFLGDGSQLSGISTGGWSTGTGTVYTSTGSNNVGIGTTTPQGGLVVTNGNVGIGTISPVSLLTLEKDNVGTAQTDGVFLTNSIAATSGNPQYSPAIHMKAAGWNTGGSVSRQVDWIIQAQPISAGPNASLGGVQFAYAPDGSGSYTDVMNMGTNGLTIGVSGTNPYTSLNEGNILVSTNAPGSATVTSAFSNVNTSSVDGFIAGSLYTTSAGNPVSNSPGVRWTSTVWDTGASASRNADFEFENDSTSGNPGSAALNLRYRYNGGSYSTLASFASNGNLGIGTIAPAGALDVEGTLYPTVFYGTGTNYNVGIGSLHPGQALDVKGTVRATQFLGDGSQLSGIGTTC